MANINLLMSVLVLKQLPSHLGYPKDNYQFAQFLTHFFFLVLCLISVSRLRSTENKENTFDRDHFWCTLDRLEAGFFYFHVLQQNNVYNMRHGRNSW